MMNFKVKFSARQIRLALVATAIMLSALPCAVAKTHTTQAYQRASVAVTPERITISIKAQKSCERLARQTAMRLLNQVMAAHKNIYKNIYWSRYRLSYLSITDDETRPKDLVSYRIILKRIKSQA